MEPEEKNTQNMQETPKPDSVPPTKGDADGVLATPTEEGAKLLAPVPFYRKKSFWISPIVLLVIAGILYFIYINNVFAPSVAEVNGVKITEAALEESVALIEASAAQQGINLAEIGAEEDVRQQALEVLINNTLLVSAAKAEGIIVTDAEVNATYDELVADLGSAEALSLQLAEIGLTEAKLRTDLEERLYAQKYFELKTDFENIPVSDEEIMNFYERLATTANIDELPPLEGIRSEIAAQIRLQKQQEIVTRVIETLRSEAEIVVHI